jgi:hypothetical protein
MFSQFWLPGSECGQYSDISTIVGSGVRHFAKQIQGSHVLAYGEIPEVTGWLQRLLKFDQLA